MSASPRAQITAGEVPAEWIDIVRTVVRRDGQALRPGPGNSIEIKSITPREMLALYDPLRLNAWCAIRLPKGGASFVTPQDRDAVLQRIQAPAAQASGNMGSM